MRPAEVTARQPGIMARYAEDLLSAGEHPSLPEALEAARVEVGTWLDTGEPRFRRFFHLFVPTLDRSVGLVWLELEPEFRRAYLAYLLIEPELRGRGHGLRVLRLVERFARRAGARRIYLYVFKQNLPAVALYRRAGYEVLTELGPPGASTPTRYRMGKLLPG
jgi:ribosomal protein S18 acetylase RimI-like enzyme